MSFSQPGSRQYQASLKAMLQINVHPLTKLMTCSSVMPVPFKARRAASCSSRQSYTYLVSSASLGRGQQAACTKQSLSYIWTKAFKELIEISANVRILYSTTLLTHSVSSLYPFSASFTNTRSSSLCRASWP